MFAHTLDAARAARFADIRVEGILDATLGVVVTYDPARGLPAVIGRHAIDAAGLYSVCLAIQNLWLAATAEGLGLGWVSFYREPFLARLIGLPPGIRPVAWLCVGPVTHLADAPDLERQGWRRRRPLDEAIHFGSWQGKTLPLPAAESVEGVTRLPAESDNLKGTTEMTGPFETAARAVQPLDAAAVADARDLLDRLTKPRGALGCLETLGVQLAGIAGTCPPPLPSPAAVAVFAGDHGVVAEAVTPWPQEVTAQMVANFVAGGAAINVLARQAGATVTVVDIGVATPLPPTCDGAEGLLRRRVRPGTGNLAVEPAMSAEDCRAALDVGAEVATALVAGGARILVTGEMGIGNTTPAAAVIAALTGRAPADVTGRGTGIDDAGLAHKVSVVERALAVHSDAVAAGPLPTLAALGGLELVALAGFVVGGAAGGVPVLVDGVTAGAALLAAERLLGGVAQRCIAGHRSVEPGATAVLQFLGMEPLIDLRLRLGEGSGACLALPLVEAAARILREMATFDAAGVTDKER